MNFNRINNITGWVVFFIASLVYILTMEATGSLWDCGEFASCAYKLQIPHPPGAPLFVLIGRLFMIPFSPATAATGINLMSALASSFTILFLFWGITHFAAKLIKKPRTEFNSTDIFITMAAGTVGALAYTFSDSFWYSAVEGEVYALSSFFTAVVFWAILKWEQNVTDEIAQGITGHFTNADRWLILIFYLMGLSIGVHLLNLLTLPAIVLVYYFKRYPVTKWGTFMAFVIGCLITGFVQIVVIQWSVKWAANMDIFFSNGFGLPIFYGFAFFFVLVAIIIYLGLRIANKNNWNFLKLGLWSFTFMLVGYTSYITTMIRSNADPTIDMYNVDNPVTLVGYLSREQYGDWPILYGNDFTDDIVSTDVKETYIKTDNGYEKRGRKISYVYDSRDKHLFPRMWDQSNDQGRADYYAHYLGIDKDDQGNWERKPTMRENISFFIDYQLGWMYMRYFYWNFVGKQNDVQGLFMNNVRDGNWKTGINFIDKIRLGDQNALPESLKNNKANNSLYGLPLILGLLGIFYQYKKDRKDLVIVGLLFFFTGIAICIYLNQAGLQPRERDYAFAGSFYAYAFWIGLGVFFVRDLLMNALKQVKAASYAAAVICMLAVPVLMASVEWDDHDRSNKTLARDLAINYLESCAPNAIVITFGDNDTYPLWYAQEVEGIRPDIRVINSSLLGTDWYINQLRYTLNESKPIDPIWTKEQIAGPTRDIIYYAPRPGIDPNQPMDLYTMMKDYAGSDDRTKMEQGRDGSLLSIYPTKMVSVPVDVEKVIQNKTVKATDDIPSEIVFQIPKNILFKNDAAILNIIAANKWERPIYFTSPYGELGFGDYLRQDGMMYRLVPVKNANLDEEFTMEVMLNKFKFGNADKKGVYFDEENRRHLNNIRLNYAQIANMFVDEGKSEQAKKLLNKYDQSVSKENIPYAMVSRNQQHNAISLQFVYAAYRANDYELAKKIMADLKKDMTEQQLYYNALPYKKREALQYEEERNESLLRALLGLENEMNKPTPFSSEMNQSVETNQP